MNRSNDPFFDSRIADWLEDDPNRAPGQVLDTILAAVPSISQRRRLPVPWRFNPMPNSIRLAAAALVVVIAVGVIYLNLPGSDGPGGQSTPSPTPSPTPTVAPSPSASQVAPGITGWTPYTSDFYGFQMSYPSDWSVNSQATREWQATDGLANPDAWPYADVFVNPEAVDGDSIGVWVWNMPAGEGANVDSVEGLKAWAEAFCTAAPALRDDDAASCRPVAQRAEAMCLVAGGDPCRAAIFAPAAGGPSAFFEDPNSATTGPVMVRVVQVGRPDDFAAANRYGGTEELLRSFLTMMNVWSR